MMKVKTIVLNSVSYTLRLTASSLASFAEATGSAGNTVFAVLDALDDLQKQGQLFAAALSHKGNTNPTQDGFESIDLLSDEGYDPIDKKQLIVELAEQSGIIGKPDAARILAGIRAGHAKLYDTAVAILSGDMGSLVAEPHESDNVAENPT